MERRVSRSELHSAENTPPPDTAAEDIEKLKGLGSFEFITIPGSTGVTKETIEGDDQDEDDEELAFQLFAPTKATESTGPAAEIVQKIRIRSPTPNLADAGFVKPHRDIKYYLASSVDGQEKDNLFIAAVSGEQIIARSHSARPGSAYPWKVTKLPASSLRRAARLMKHPVKKQVDDQTSDNENEDEKVPEVENGITHKRKGKKMRIKIRTRLATELKQKEEAKAAEANREVADREKKTQRNREKKAKKKAREKAEKAKKAQAGGEEVDEVASEMSFDED